MKAKSFIIILFIAYAGSLYCKFNHLETPEWFSSYFADLLCLPILLFLTLFSMRKILGKPRLWLSPAMIIFVWTYLSFIFELWLPSISNTYTADPLDVLFYGAGGLFYFSFQKTIFAPASFKTM